LGEAHGEGGEVGGGGDEEGETFTEGTGGRGEDGEGEAGEEGGSGVSLGVKKTKSQIIRNTGEGLRLQGPLSVAIHKTYRANNSLFFISFVVFIHAIN